MFVHACYLLWIYKYKHNFIKQSHNMYVLNLAKEQTQGEQPTWQKRTTTMFNKYRLWRKMGWGGPPNADPYIYIYTIIFRCCGHISAILLNCLQSKQRTLSGACWNWPEAEATYIACRKGLSFKRQICQWWIQKKSMYVCIYIYTWLYLFVVYTCRNRKKGFFRFDKVGNRWSWKIVEHIWLIEDKKYGDEQL